jgi:hypothetical protein
MRVGEAHSIVDRAEHMARLLRIASDQKLTLAVVETRMVKPGDEGWAEGHAYIDTHQTDGDTP